MSPTLYLRGSSRINLLKEANNTASPLDEGVESDKDHVSNVDITTQPPPKTLKDEVLAEIKNQGLPEDIFSSPNINWIEILSTAAPSTIQDIKEVHHPHQPNDISSIGN